MKTQPIFTVSFLEKYLQDFKLSDITNNHGILVKINELMEELKAEKFDSLKEEEIKSRFIITFFGDILGFSQDSPDKWLSREEKKVAIGGRKADAALGFFYKNKLNDIVRAVVEIKDATTELDKKQKRENNMTPVEQAFSYVSGMKGECRWVIVSNIKEIRFYPSLDNSKTQKFLLEELINESKLKELIFLFHKDKFIKERDESPTDKLYARTRKSVLGNNTHNHIIDELFYSLKRFDGLNFIAPDYIANLFPFNISNDRVWHYENYTLYTLNKGIYDILTKIGFENGEISLSEELRKEILLKTVIEAESKLKYIFEFLNKCLISEIKAVGDIELFKRKKVSSFGFTILHWDFSDVNKGISKSIAAFKTSDIDCFNYNYRNFDFQKMFEKIKVYEGNDNLNSLEFAFGNYLLANNDYKTSYTIYRNILVKLKGKQGKGIEYFLAKLNLRYLYNLIKYNYSLNDQQLILNEIKSVDLDLTIHDEIEFDIDKDIRKYLIELKEENLIQKVQNQVDSIINEIEELKQLYDNNGERSAGPNLSQKLIKQYLLLYKQINSNYIIYEGFSEYKTIMWKIFKGLIRSYQTPNWGIKQFDDFILTEAMLHISPEKLRKILTAIDTLEVEEGCVEKLLGKLYSFVRSFVKIGIFADPYSNTMTNQFLTNLDFEDKLRHLFDNLFTVLVKIDISPNQFSFGKQTLINFLKVESFLAWPELNTLSTFIVEKGFLFTKEELYELLRIAINGDRYGFNKYNHLIEFISEAIQKYYPEFKITNEAIITKATTNCWSDDGESAGFTHLLLLANICDSKCQEVLFSSFEKSIDKRFSITFYESLLRETKYDLNRKDYFIRYIEDTNKYKNAGYTFINFICVLTIRKIDRGRPEFELLNNLNDFQEWLLFPRKFDYQKFDPQWLLEIQNLVIMDDIEGLSSIGEAIENLLRSEYNPVLAEIKYKHFTSSGN